MCTPFGSSSYLTLITNELDIDQAGSERKVVYSGVGKQEKYSTEFVLEMVVTIHSNVIAKQIY